ncbi:MAG: GxxExxY protein [Bacteroidales bacterium]|nr:GxxExxY protein [Bacteroidales bacterium]
MNILDNQVLYKKESYRIVGAAMEVHKILGCGFSEAVYQEAFENELWLCDIPFDREKNYKINYKGIILDKTFRADFVCFDKIIVELKAVSELSEGCYSQVYNYLKASGLKLGILINFGLPSLEVKRIPCVTKWIGE